MLQKLILNVAQLHFKLISLQASTEKELIQIHSKPHSEAGLQRI